MRDFGWGLVIAGLLWAAVALNMSTTVETGDGRSDLGRFSADVPQMTVHNIGLMDKRRNHLIMACVTLIAGVILIGFGSISRPYGEHRACPNCAELVKAEAKVCRFCQGELVSLEAERIAAKVEEFRRAGGIGTPGICPNCGSWIALDSTDCPKCPARFGPGSLWKVVKPFDDLESKEAEADKGPRSN